PDHHRTHLRGTSNLMGSDEKYRRVKRALLGLLLAGCVVARPATPSLPDGFPSDFPVPPNARLITASGPLPFVPAEMRTITAQWSSALSRAALEAFYRAPHPGWRATATGTVPGSPTPVDGFASSPITWTSICSGASRKVAIGYVSQPVVVMRPSR